MKKSSSKVSGVRRPRGYHVDLKQARGRSPSSQRWLRRQLNDPFVRQANADGYRSRAAYKLLEIAEQFSLFRPGINVIDIGCAPGGWLQVIDKLSRNQKKVGKIIGIDILETEPMKDIILFQGDAREPAEQEKIWNSCDGQVDLVLSDMAAPMTGHARTDHVNVAVLAETAWEIAEAILAEKGHFVCKVFAGGAEESLLQRLKMNFKRVKHCKPQASRKESRELYLVAESRKTKPILKQNHQDTLDTEI